MSDEKNVTVAEMRALLVEEILPMIQKTHELVKARDKAFSELSAFVKARDAVLTERLNALEAFIQNDAMGRKIYLPVN